MWKTVLALLVTIIVIPFVAFKFDDPLISLQSSVLTRLAVIYLVAALLCFFVSTISNNYSQVDKLWSTIPLVYVWVMAWESGFEARIVLMAILVSARVSITMKAINMTARTPGASGSVITSRVVVVSPGGSGKVKRITDGQFSGQSQNLPPAGSGFCSTFCLFLFTRWA